MTLCGIERQISLSPLVASKWTGGVGEVSLEVVEESLMPCASAGTTFGQSLWDDAGI